MFCKNRCSYKFCKFLFCKPKASNFIQTQALALAFSCEFCKILKNTFFTEHLWWLLLAEGSSLRLTDRWTEDVAVSSWFSAASTVSIYKLGAVCRVMCVNESARKWSWSKNLHLLKPKSPFLYQIFLNFQLSVLFV